MPNTIPDTVFWILMIFLVVCAAAVTALVGAIWAMLRDKFKSISDRLDNIFGMIGKNGENTSRLEIRISVVEELCRERHGISGRRRTNGCIDDRSAT